MTQQTRLYEAALQRLADQSRMIADRDDRIAELEAAVRNQAMIYTELKARLQAKEDGLRVRDDRIAELEAAVTRLTLALEMERGRGQPRAEHDRSFPDLGPSVRDVGRQDVLREIVEIAALYYDAADTMLDGPDESDKDMARGCIREAHKRLLAIKPAMDAALTPARTYAEGIEDAAKVAEKYRGHTNEWIASTIRALGTKP